MQTPEVLNLSSLCSQIHHHQVKFTIIKPNQSNSSHQRHHSNLADRFEPFPSRIHHWNYEIGLQDDGSQQAVVGGEWTAGRRASHGGLVGAWWPATVASWGHGGLRAAGEQAAAATRKWGGAGTCGRPHWGAMAGERSRRLPAAAACASCRPQRRVRAAGWGAAAVGAVGRMRGPDGAPTSERREGRKEGLSSVGCRMRARLEKFFYR